MVDRCWILAAVFGSFAASMIYNKRHLQSLLHVEIIAWNRVTLFFVYARVFIKLTFNI